MDEEKNIQMTDDEKVESEQTGIEEIIAEEMKTESISEIIEVQKTYKEKLKELKENTELSAWQKFKEKRRLKKEEQRRREEAKSTLQNICETILFFAVAMIIALVIKNYIGQPIIVDGDSMNNTLKHHQVVWANKVNYTPERFDVVIIEPYDDEKTLYIKRVIALPGETIYIDAEDKIHITPADSNESYVLEDPYGDFFGTAFSKMIMFANNPDGSYTLGEDEYFCMGDNRYNSKDSRSLGAFTEDQIKGHAVLRIWPLNQIGDFEK